MTGANWYANYWYAVGNYPASKWDGNYIAVVEPPLKEGVAKAPKLVEEGEVISEDKAKSMAMSWFKKLGIDKRAHYAILRNSEPLRPLLVNAKHKGYYIVPLGYEEGRLSQGAVLLNAYNGDFLEVGVFQKPIKYLSEDRAVKIAINYLCACKYTREKIQVRLIFQPSEQTQSRFLPVWEITVEEVTVYITQEGTVFEQLTPLPLGD